MGNASKSVLCFIMLATLVLAGCASPPPKPSLTNKKSHPASKPIPARCNFPKPVVLDTAKALQRFASLECPRMAGDLEIRGGIENLRGLNDLREIHGSLRIIGTEKLKRLTAFDDLSRVEDGLIVQDNAHLRSLAMLGGLDHLGGNLIVQSNAKLASLSDLFITGQRLSGDLRITNNPKLTDLFAFRYVRQVNGSVVLEHLPISNLIGLDKLQDINGDLVLSNLPELHSLDILKRLRSVGGDFVVSGKVGFLPQCEIKYWRGISNVVSGVIRIQPTSARLVLESQEELDRFESRGCQHVDGSIHVEGTEAADFRLLGHLRYIEGDLVIQNNPHLVTLEGLQHLEQVGGDLRIVQNPNLYSISFLVGLRRIEGALHIEKLAGAVWVENLASLRHIGQGLIIENNPQLTSIRNFNQLETIYGDLRIQHNPSLRTITDLSPRWVSGNVEISRNPSLRFLGAFGTACRVGGQVRIWRNFALEKEHLEKIEARLETARHSPQPNDPAASKTPANKLNK